MAVDSQQVWFELSEEQVECLKCDDLRRSLAQARQPTSGRKAELQVRLKKAIADYHASQEEEHAQNASEQDHTPVVSGSSSSLPSSSSFPSSSTADTQSDDLSAITKFAESQQPSDEVSSSVPSGSNDGDASNPTAAAEVDIAIANIADSNLNDSHTESLSNHAQKKRKLVEAESTDSSEPSSPSRVADSNACASTANGSREGGTSSSLSSNPAPAATTVKSNIGEQSSTESESTAQSAAPAPESTAPSSTSLVPRRPPSSASSSSSYSGPSSSSVIAPRRPGSADSASGRRRGGSSSPCKGRVFRQRYSEIRDYLATLEDEQLRDLMLNVIAENGFVQKGLPCTDADSFVQRAMNPTSIELARNPTGEDVFNSLHHCMHTDTTLNKIFLRKLSYDTKDSTLDRVFSQFGTVKEVCIVKEKDSGRSRGFGFVIMTTAEEATRALAEFEKVIDGKTVICNLASKPQGVRTFPTGESGTHTRRNAGGGRRRGGQRSRRKGY